MASAVDMANGALALCGVSPLNGLDDTGEAARVVNARFYDVLDSMIVDFPWNFAIKRQELARSVDAPESEYNYKYALPSDCLHVEGEVNDYDFVIEEEGFLLSNAEEINIIYLKRIEDMSELPPYFRDAFHYKLAGEICYNLTGDLDNVDRIRQIGAYTLKAAKLRDSQEGTPKTPKVGSWIQRRYNVRRR